MMKRERYELFGYWWSVETFPRSLVRPFRRHRVQVEAANGVFWESWYRSRSKARLVGLNVAYMFCNRDPNNLMRDRIAS